MEELARKLHEWYLEATKELNPKSFNPDAQKSYDELTDEQRFIDKYIADKVKQHLREIIDKHWGKDSIDGNYQYLIKEMKL